MIELTTAYKQLGDGKFLLNPLYIICVSWCENYAHPQCEGANSFVEYIGAGETQQVYVRETYEQIKEMLK
jgi:hypothetical protein